MFRLIVVSIAVVIVCAVTLIGGVFKAMRNDLRAEPFTSAGWRTTDVRAGNLRTRMLTDLTDRIRLEKWRYERVVAELGPPTATRPYPVPAGPALAGRRVLVYPLGPVLTRFKDKTWSLLIDTAQADGPALWTVTDYNGQVRYYERPPTRLTQNKTASAG